MGRHALSSMLVSGQITYGQWCPTCQLSSAGLVPLVMIGVSGVMPIGTVTLCLDCHSEDFTLTERLP